MPDGLDLDALEHQIRFNAASMGVKYLAAGNGLALDLIAELRATRAERDRAQDGTRWDATLARAERAEARIEELEADLSLAYLASEQQAARIVAADDLLIHISAMAGADINCRLWLRDIRRALNGGNA